MSASIVEDAEARADAAEYLYGVNDGITVVEGGNWVVMTNPVYAERVADVLGGTVVEE